MMGRAVSREEADELVRSMDYAMSGVRKRATKKKTRDLP